MTTSAPKPQPVLRAAIYCRISLDTEGDELGVKRQERACRRYCKANGWEVAGVYVDNDVSAWRPGVVRPEYKRMLEDIEAGTVTAVVVFELSRLHRQPRDLERFLDLCASVGLTDMKCVQGDVDLGTSTGKMVARMLGAADAKASDDTSTRMKLKIAEKAENGQPIGRRPYGYLQQDRTLVVIPEEAEVVVAMVDRILTGESFMSIALDLNARGIRASQGGTWGTTQVRGAVSNPAIAGLLRYQGNIVGEGNWTAIIKRAKWEKALRMVDRRRQRRLSPPRFRLLTGLVFCGRCGEPLCYNAAAHKGRYVALECHKGPQKDACGALSITSDKVEQEVVEGLLRAMDGPAYAAVRAGDSDAEADAARAVIARIEEQKQELMAEWTGGGLTRDEWRVGRDTLNARLNAARARLSAYDERVDTQGLLGAPGSLRGSWPGMSLERQRAVLAAVIDRIVIAPTDRRGCVFDPTRIQITWRG